MLLLKHVVAATSTNAHEMVIHQNLKWNRLEQTISFHSFPDF